MDYPAASGRPSGGNAGVYAKGLNNCRKYFYRLPVNPEPGQKLSWAQYLDYAERVEKSSVVKVGRGPWCSTAARRR